MTILDHSLWYCWWNKRLETSSDIIGRIKASESKIRCIYDMVYWRRRIILIIIQSCCIISSLCDVIWYGGILIEFIWILIIVCCCCSNLHFVIWDWSCWLRKFRSNKIGKILTSNIISPTCVIHTSLYSCWWIIYISSIIITFCHYWIRICDMTFSLTSTIINWIHV